MKQHSYENRINQLKEYHQKNNTPMFQDLTKATLSAWAKIEDYGMSKNRAIKEASKKYSCSQQSIREVLNNLKVKYVAQEKYKKQVKPMLIELYQQKENFINKLETEDYQEMETKKNRRRIKEYKNFRINFNVTQSEKNEFELRANEKGMNITDYIIDCCLNNHNETEQVEEIEFVSFEEFSKLEEKVNELNSNLEKVMQLFRGI